MIEERTPARRLHTRAPVKRYVKRGVGSGAACARVHDDADRETKSWRVLSSCWATNLLSTKPFPHYSANRIVERTHHLRPLIESLETTTADIWAFQDDIATVKTNVVDALDKLQDKVVAL